MKTKKTLIFISVLALFFIQCTTRPSHRTHSNAVGIWFGGTSSYTDDNENEDFALGIDFKQVYNPMQFFNYKYEFLQIINFGWNVYAGIHERVNSNGYDLGLSLDATCRILTEDLIWKGIVGQWHIGPNAGFTSYINNSLNPRIGIALGALVLISGSKKYPESDIGFEGAWDPRKDKMDEIMVRLLYHAYLF